MKKKKVMTIIGIIVLFGILITGTIFITYNLTKNSNKSLEIESLEVFGKKIKVVKGKNYYRIGLSSASINYDGSSCDVPIKIEFSNKQSYSSEFSGGLYNGSDRAYFGINVEQDNIDETLIEQDKEVKNLQYYDYFIEVYFVDEPLKIDAAC
jgi:hypothetical protein